MFLSLNEQKTAEFLSTRNQSASGVSVSPVFSLHESLSSHSDWLWGEPPNLLCIINQESVCTQLVWISSDRSGETLWKLSENRDQLAGLLQSWTAEKDTRQQALRSSAVSSRQNHLDQPVKCVESSVTSPSYMCNCCRSTRRCELSVTDRLSSLNCFQSGNNDLTLTLKHTEHVIFGKALLKQFVSASTMSDCDSRAASRGNSRF